MTNAKQYEIRYDEVNKYFLIRELETTHLKSGKRYYNEKAVVSFAKTQISQYGLDVCQLKLDESVKKANGFVDFYYDEIGKHICKRNGLELIVEDKAEDSEVTEEIGEDGIVKVLEASHTTGSTY